MNRKSAPNPPADLLARCLETIPATAIKSSVPRFYPDAGSRKRLAWLAAVAAVPVITMLAVLPAKHLIEQHHSRSDTSAVPATPERLSYVRANVSRWVIHTDNPTRLQVQLRGETLQILDRERGMLFRVLRYRNEIQAVAGKWSQLVLPNGKHYIVANNTLMDDELVGEYNDTFNVNVSQLLSAEALEEHVVGYKPIKVFSRSSSKGNNGERVDTIHYEILKGSMGNLVSGRARRPLRISRERVLAAGSPVVKKVSYFLHTSDGSHSKVSQVKLPIYSVTFDYVREPGEERYYVPHQFLRLAKQAKRIDSR